MERKTLAITAPLLLSSAMFFTLRGAFGSSKAFRSLLLLSCLLFPLTLSSGRCSVNGMHNPAEYDSCGSPGYNPVAGFQDSSHGDASSSNVAESSAARQSIQRVCTSSHSFCFLSSLGSGNQSDRFFFLGASDPSKPWTERNWPSDYGMFELMNGKKVLCSLNSGDGIPSTSSVGTGNTKKCLSDCRGTLLKDKDDSDFRISDNPGMAKSDSFSVPSAVSVEISPPVLDWKEKLLFFPSVAFLTVANKCNNSILHVYEPFSTDKQFYPCNGSEVLLLPGESASVCFMFLPRWLGLSSAHLVLQTNRGGFLVQAKGFAVKSLYGTQPLVSIDVPSNPWSTKNFSFFNPLDEPLYVKEVTAWISISSENASHQIEVSCFVENRDFHEILLLDLKDQLVVKSYNLRPFQSVAVRPQGGWEIGPRKRETIMEMELLPNFQDISGSLSLQLLRGSQEHVDTIIFPLEVDLGKQTTGADPRGLVSVFLEPLVSYDANEMIVAVSLINNAPYLLAVVNITSLFHIKHTEGLLLFPGSVTQAALISCAHLPLEFSDTLLEEPDIQKSCVVLVLTNDSSSRELEILCQDVFHICSRNKKGSGNKKAGSTASDMSSPSEFKAFEGAKQDELILGNWKSQGIMHSLSVLKEAEVFFPMVQVGTHSSKWITVKNPSQEPVVMQLVLNSGAIIDKCKGEDGVFHSSLIDSSVHDKAGELEKNGFSVTERAVTEAYVYPHSDVAFGPIDFYPSRRCRWRSSALIRNNLSGVEWLSLEGLGGSLSLILLEGSKLVQSIEFEETTSSCDQPLSKELYAKNTGDLPLDVKSISVCGSRCGGDGFVVHQCDGFFIDPGESTKIHVSYQTGFSASVVHRDLEFILASGAVLAVPMKASIPVLMLNRCKKSVFWVRLKKFSMAVLLAVALSFLVLYLVFPQMMAFNSQDRFYENNKKPRSHVAIRGFEKSSSYVQEKSNFAISPEMDSLLRSIGEETLGRFTSGKDGGSESNISTKETQPRNSPAPVPSIEASEPVNLTVKTGKDKKKRRKKKKGLAAGLTTGLIEVSSSHSGNSTPNSPMSPVTSATPESNPFTRVDPEHSRSAQATKPAESLRAILSHSATFPSAGNRSATNNVRCCSPLAPHARAPGAKLCGGERGKGEETQGKVKKEYMYDIWGDHLSGLHLMDRFKDVNGGKSSGLAEDGGESESFFVKGPQSFLANSHPRYVSFFNQRG